MLKSSEGPSLCQQTDGTGLSCLGIALGFHAPVDVIALMIEVHPDIIYHEDAYGASCLHIACLNGSSLEAIDYLVSNFPHLIDSTDNDKRIPLHHAVEFACQCQNQADENFYLEMIATLCKVKPETIFCSDVAHDSPIDLSQMFKLSSDHGDHDRLDKIYYLLQHYGIEQYMRQKKKWEQEGYDTNTHSSKVKREDGLSKSTDSTGTLSVSKGTVISKVSTLVAERCHSERDCLSRCDEEMESKSELERISQSLEESRL